MSRSQSRSRFNMPIGLKEEHSVLKISPENANKAAFDIVVVVDPVSRGAQKIGPMLSVIKQILNCNIKVYLNCVSKNSDMPLKR